MPTARRIDATIRPPIALDALHLPELLDRLEIVRAGEGNRVEISDRDRWAAPLDEMARRVLAQDLAARLPENALIPAEARSGAPVRHLVVNLDEFAADAAGHVVLDGNWALLAGTAREPALRRHERIVIDRPARDAAEEAAAMSLALDELADRIAAAIATAGPARSDAAPPSRHRLSGAAGAD